MSTTTTSDVAEWQARYLRESFAKNVGAITARLRQLAEDIEQHGERYADDPLRAAAVIQNEIMWGMANLHLDALTSAAADYERALAGK
jgi:hypothetical protein